MALAGCGGSSKPEHASTRVETAWLNKLQRWLDVEAGQGTYVDCARRVAADVGQAPSADLEKLYTDMQATCRLFDRWHADEDKGLSGHDFTLYAKSQTELPRAQAALSKVRREVEATRPGLPVLTVRGGLTDDSRIEPLYSRVASKLAGAPVQIRCWSAHDWSRVQRVIKASTAITFDLAGFADPASSSADLAPDVCHDLTQFVYGHEARGNGLVLQAFAVDVLAHESNHLAGPNAGETEAITECNALQTTRRTAELLGAKPSLANRLARVDWTVVYPFHSDEYFTHDCRPGGPLDHHPGGAWP
jgi:hypothetical protein